jgi:GNAT superfamily N-acetyltransferase
LGEGRFLYLEDLFLEVEYRQRGGGNLVMQTLAQICQSLQCTHLYWQALDWNTSGLQFYDKIGAEILEGVMTSRYCGDAMKAFAEKETG